MTFWCCLGPPFISLVLLLLCIYAGKPSWFRACDVLAERCPFWCVAFLHRDEELDSKETAQEEDSQGESGLGISKKQTLKIGLFVEILQGV